MSGDAGLVGGFPTLMEASVDGRGRGAAGLCFLSARWSWSRESLCGAQETISERPRLDC